MNIWTSLTSLGFEYAVSASQRRSVFLSNVMSIALSCLGFILGVVYYFWYGVSFITISIPIVSFFCLMPLLLNHWNLSGLARLWLCLFVPVTVMGLSIYSKVEYYERAEELDYFTFRIIILSTCVFPPIFFSVREKTAFALTSLLLLTLLMLHDPLHRHFNVAYEDLSMHRSNYGFTNVVILMVYLMMTGAVTFMKGVSEANELKTQRLINVLNETNQKLTEKNNEVEIRNHEILDQAEKLNVSRQKLTDAYKVIEEQRNLLFIQNKTLSTELVEKNKELTETNNELIKHNNELRQFSYTVSHNLRGPVASLLGLLKLFNHSDLSKENIEILQHLESSAYRLDGIIKDLSKIIDIRHDIFQIRQQINLDREINEILEVLGREIETHNVSMNVNLSRAGIIYSVKPMVHSIVYNLISNAIKYRSPERKSLISVTSYDDDHYYYIEVTDNGLGIDLGKNKDHLFRLYKRFHHHVEGKGLGLYLVKLQAEALGGSITVESEPNRFTTFRIRLKKPENAERQKLHQDTFAEIFYDARMNCIGVNWSQEATHEQYTEVTQKVLEFINAYNTPNYLSDASRQLNLEPLATYPVLRKMVKEAAKHGLVRVALVYPRNLKDGHSLDGIGDTPVTIRTFSELSNAVEWIDHENAAPPKKLTGQWKNS